MDTPLFTIICHQCATTTTVVQSGSYNHYLHGDVAMNIENNNDDNAAIVIMCPCGNKITIQA